MNNTVKEGTNKSGSKSLSHNQHVDELKGWLIFTVVWGHVSNALYGGSSGYYFIKLITSTFGMPLFMLISGYLGNSQYGKGMLTFINGKTKRLLLPYIVWTLMGCAVDIVAYRQFTTDSVVRVLYNQLPLYWYLLSLYFITFVVYFIKALVKKCTVQWAIFLLISIGLLFLPEWKVIDYFYIPWLFPFYCIGDFIAVVKSEKYTDQYRVSRYGSVDHQNSHISKPIGILSILIYCVLLFCFKGEYLVYSAGSTLKLHDNFTCQIYIILIRFVIGLFGCVAFSYLVKTLGSIFGKKQSAIVKQIRYLGVHSLDVYIIHVLLVSVMLTGVIGYATKFTGFTFFQQNKFLTCYVFAPIVSVVTCYICCYSLRFMYSTKAGCLVLGKKC